MKVKTSELTGAALAWVLLQVEYSELSFRLIFNEGKLEVWNDDDVGTTHPSLDRQGKPRFIRASDGVPVSLFGCPIEFVDWATCGPIIEREGILLRALRREGHALDGQWLAMYDGTNTGTMVSWVKRTDFPRHYLSGPTPLIAAMRCYVASKLGDEVDIPEELK